jgi:hypothetical protein
MCLLAQNLQQIWSLAVSVRYELLTVDIYKLGEETDAAFIHFRWPFYWFLSFVLTIIIHNDRKNMWTGMIWE